MLKNQTVNHVSEHLSAICPVCTQKGGLKKNNATRPMKKKLIRYLPIPMTGKPNPSN